MTLPPADQSANRASNVTLWVVFALTSVGVGGFFLIELHRGLNRDSLLAAAGLLSRTALFVSVGLLVEALLIRAGDGFFTLSRTRRAVLHTHWIMIMLLCVALVVDLAVFAFAGYHLPTALRILFSDGPSGVGKVVEATGLSPSLVIAGTAGLALGLAVAIVLSKYSRRLSSRAGIFLSRRVALHAVFTSIAALAMVEMVSFRLRNPFLWEQEIRRVPLAFAFSRPAAELASFRVSIRQPKQAQEPMTAEKPVRLERMPDIFIVIVESIRKDTVVPEIMPHLSAFSRSAWTFEHPLTTGNVTHFSWYGLLCSQLPIFFSAAKEAQEHAGSLPLQRLRRLGYKINLFATPDTEYQKIESIVFGSSSTGIGGSLLDTKFHPKAHAVAERDELVIGELSRQLASKPAGGGVYVVALDSSHFSYEWGGAFKPPFQPFAEDISIAKSYQFDSQAREAVINRYKDSVAWVDQLLGRFFDSLKSSGRSESSMVVVTGDHGEAFWEHGAGTHGSDLSREQLEVGFALRLPGRAPQHSAGVLSLLDVMPTLLDELGVATDGLAGIPAQKYSLSRSGSEATQQKGPAIGPPPRGALTFQGWNEQTFRFALTFETQRMLFELDQVNPLQARRLVLRDVTDLQDLSLVGRPGTDLPDAYNGVIRNLPAVMDSLPFIEM